jgi:glucokinase
VTTPTAAAIDIGGTKIAAALVSRDGLVGGVRFVPTHAIEGGEAVLQRSIELMQRVVSESGTPAPSAIGIAAGGWIDRSSGRVISATDLLPGWTGTDLRSEFERGIGLPALAINDVHAMGIAEARLGAGRGQRLCVSVAVGTGIGGAITVDGQLLEGAHGMAGALGHIPFRAGGALCSCGRRGCIEAYASGPAIAAAFAECAGLSKSKVVLPDVFDALGSSQEPERECARQATATAGAALGRVLGGLANTIDPDVIVLGGGAALALGEVFIEAVRSAIDECVVRPISSDVLVAQLGTAAGIIGAGLVALDGEKRISWG